MSYPTSSIDDIKLSMLRHKLAEAEQTYVRLWHSGSTSATTLKRASRRLDKARAALEDWARPEEPAKLQEGAQS